MTQFSGIFRAASLATAAFAFGVLQALALDPQKAITQFNHRSWGAADGIDMVYAIAQTADGRLWISTIKGVYQFDGLGFVPLSSAGVDLSALKIDPADLYTISPPILLGSHDGSLWIGRGQDIMRYQNGHLTKYPPPGGHVHAIVEGKNGEIWVCTEGALARFANGEWQKLGEEIGVQKGEVGTAFVDREGTLWVEVHNRKQKPSHIIASRSPGGSHFEVAGDIDEQTSKIAQAPDGKLWIPQSRCTRAFVGEQGRLHFLHPEIALSVTTGLFFDRDGSLWLPTLGEGLRRVRNTTDIPTNDIPSSSDVLDQYTQKDGLSGEDALSALEDKEGNIWIGTSRGLDCFSETKITFLSVREGLPFDQNLLLQASADGSVWMASMDGFARMKMGARQFDFLGWGSMNFAPHFVMSLYASPAGTVYAGTRAPGFIKFEASSTNAISRPVMAEFKGVQAITAEHSGAIWTCDFERGIRRWMPNGQEPIDYEPRIANDFVIAAYGDTAGRVWLGSLAGHVACYDEALHATWYSAKDGLFAGSVRCFFGDTKGRIWVAGNGGLSEFKKNRFQTLTQKSGLPEDNLYGILQDDLGFLWLEGWSTLFRVSPDALDSALSLPGGQVAGEVFDSSDGLRGLVHGSQFNYGKSYPTKSADGRLWFPTTAGLAVIDPHHIPHNPLPPPVHVERIIIAGKTNQTFDHLEFPVGARACEIDYAGLSFVDPQKVHYKYKLSGVDENWVEAGMRRQAFYSNLKPRKYTFQVQACNNDRVWNEIGDTVAFSVRPAFYETTWFPVLVTMTVGSALLGLHRLRLARLARLRTLEGKLSRATQVASFAELSASIAHEINQPLAGVVTNANACMRWLAGAAPNLDEAREAVQRIVRDGNRGSEVVARIRALLKKEQPSKARLDANEIIREILTLGQVESNGTVLQMELANQLPQVSADRVQLQQVLLNLIMNAIDAMKSVSDRPRVLHIETKRYQSDAVLVAVKDSGVGLDPKTIEQLFETFYTTKPNGIGLGLSISRSIIEAHGGRLWAKSNDGPGATFQFTLPAEKGGVT